MIEPIIDPDASISGADQKLVRALEGQPSVGFCGLHEDLCMNYFPAWGDLIPDQKQLMERGLILAHGWMVQSFTEGRQANRSCGSWSPCLCSQKQRC